MFNTYRLTVHSIASNEHKAKVIDVYSQGLTIKHAVINYLIDNDIKVILGTGNDMRADNASIFNIVFNDDLMTEKELAECDDEQTIFVTNTLVKEVVHNKMIFYNVYGHPKPYASKD